MKIKIEAHNYGCCTDDVLAVLAPEDIKEIAYDGDGTLQITLNDDTVTSYGYLIFKRE